MRRILIAGILGGLAMFIWETIAHMVLPLGEIGLSGLPHEAAVREALAAQLGDNEGLYLYPAMVMGEQPTAGPSGLLLYHPGVTFSFAVIGWEAATELVQGLALALLVSLAAAESFARRLGLALLVGIAAAFSVSPGYAIWFGFPLSYTLSQMLIVLVGYLAAGAAVAWMLRPRPAEAE